MNEDIAEFEGTYAEAVAEANRRHLEHGLTVSVVSHMTYYYRVVNGIGTSKNINSGVPDTQYVGKDWLAAVGI